MLHLLRQLILILLLVSPCVSVSASLAEMRGGADPELAKEVQAALEKGEKMARTIKLPQKDYHYLPPKIRKVVQQGMKEDDKDGKVGRLYLLLSSSIPIPTVHNYLQAINALQPTVEVMPVMRGMIGGIFDKSGMKKFFSQVLKEDLDCDDIPTESCPRFKIDIRFMPSLFTKYAIERVPALVYDNGKEQIIIHGDAALDYLLERISQEAHNKGLADLVARIRGRNNE